MAFAGVWEGYRWPDGTLTRSFAIITTDAGTLRVWPVHRRVDSPKNNGPELWGPMEAA